MSPVWMIEGGATAVAEDEPRDDTQRLAVGEPADPNSARNAAERRLAALAAAIRDHESRRRYQAVPARPEDLMLYRRLRQVCGGV
jgi:hypothetical protein